MSSSVCPCTLLELHVGSPRQQPNGAISAHVMTLTHQRFQRADSRICLEEITVNTEVGQKNPGKFAVAQAYYIFF